MTTAQQHLHYCYLLTISPFVSCLQSIMHNFAAF